MVKDIKGVILEVGQLVVTNPPLYKGLARAIVIKLTKHGATVRTIEADTNRGLLQPASYNRHGSFLFVIEEDVKEERAGHERI